MEIRRSYNRRISPMGFSILIRRHLYTCIKLVPGCPEDHCWATVISAPHTSSSINQNNWTGRNTQRKLGFVCYWSSFSRKTVGSLTWAYISTIMIRLSHCELTEHDNWKVKCIYTKHVWYHFCWHHEQLQVITYTMLYNARKHIYIYVSIQLAMQIRHNCTCICPTI